MKITKKALVLFLLTSLSAIAQQKLTLEEIWGGAFRTQGMTELTSLKNTNEYTVLDSDRTTKSSQINLYDFATLNKISTLIDTKDFKQLEGIDSYTFSKDEKKILIAINSDQIFRHSFVADYYIYDITTKSLTKIADYKIQEPTFSPDGSKIAFAKGNNLFVYELASKKTTQITSDGKKNEIINGITDWVYEEEFAFVRAFDWNTSSDKIAFIRFDESQVPEFSMNIYGNDLYPVTDKFKYPKAGEKNAEVSLHIYDIKSASTKKIDLSKYNDFYIARLEFTNEANTLSAQVLNRHQDNLDLLFVNANSGATKVILNEKDKAYVDVTDNLTFLKDSSFIWTSEKDGFNHIYNYDATGKLKNQITKGNWEVTNYYGFDEKAKIVYYQSVENGSINRDVYSISLDGKNKKRLTTQIGTNGATFSPNFQYFINSF
ncbi:DPP IV N-terminal domain-containing protein, partial [Flavobacterium sp.]|uniref:beta-propeller domain-containing protein n=1 Tax=Flavobacterium sp. TaxID=239 RepID=UPI00286D2D49